MQGILDLLKRAGGKIGSLTGNKELQLLGAEPLTTEQRINKSLQKTGGVAEGDFTTAAGMGYVAPSRADGGILTRNQAITNANTASNISKALTNEDAIKMGYTGLDDMRDNQASEASGSGGDANSFLQDRLNSIMSYLGILRGEGDRLRGVAKGVRDEAVGNIDTRYGGLASAAKQKRTDSLNTLAENDRGVVRDYAIGQGSMNKASEGTKLKNRALARALGFGNGSYYTNMQMNNNNTLEDNTAKMTNERSGKLGEIKNEVGRTNTWFDQKDTEIANEAAMLKSQADREYQDNVSKSILAEQSWGIDRVDAAQQAQDQYLARLGEIDDYVKKKTIMNDIASKAGAQESVITSRPLISEGTQGVLADNTNYDAGLNMKLEGILGGFSNPSTGGVYNKTLSKKKNPWDDYIYGGVPTGGGSSWA